MVKYQQPKINYKKRRPSKTVPDQSLSIKEIVSRFVRGIPVDVQQREGVYVDQSDHDLEKLSRMDFAEKADMAAVLAQQAAQMQNELQENERSQAEAREKAAKTAAEQEAARIDEAVKRASQRPQA